MKVTTASGLPTHPTAKPFPLFHSMTLGRMRWAYFMR